MQFQKEHATGYIPDEVELEKATARTTHLAIGAHQDDLEIMAYHGILECYEKEDKWFTGVTCTDGRNSPRHGEYADFSDDLMAGIRSEEQMDAADIGKYSAIFQLAYRSEEIKNPEEDSLVQDLLTVLTNIQPDILYTHNPADKHEAHVAVFQATLKAIRQLPADKRPKAVYGCEVWRNLDWLPDDDKVVLDVSGNNQLALDLIQAFVSQVSGGKNYIDSTIGRRRANATFHRSHQVDAATDVCYAMDLTPLCLDDSLDVKRYVLGFVEGLNDDIREKLSIYFD